MQGELGLGVGAVKEEQQYIFTENGEIIIASGYELNNENFTPDEGKTWALADDLMAGK